MPDDFLKNAEKIRKQLMDVSTNIVEPKTSKYNSKLIVSACGICGYIPNGGIPLDTHHIVYQQNQDENGFVKINNTNFHKNEEYNLVPLCKKCHDEEHNGNLNIKGYVETTNGRKILYEYLNKNNEGSGDPSEELTKITKIKKLISFENDLIGGKWKYRKSPRSKWSIVEKEFIEEYLKNNDLNFQLDLFKNK